MDLVYKLLNKEIVKNLIKGSSGLLGSAGIFGSFSRVFIGFGILSGPASFLIDAPFGRSVPALSSLTINGGIGWLLMEIVSPIAFLIGFSSKLSTNPIDFFSIPSLETIISPFYNLPKARVLLASLFLLHYFNRSIVSTIRNPGRARMHISVPLSAVIFNVMNGFLMGFNLSGGGVGDWCNVSEWGLQEDGLFDGISSLASYETLFIVGISLFSIGMISNIYCDEILYSLKRNRQATTVKSTHWQPHRYSIPHGFLFSYPFGGISSPSYFCEWIEWSGFLIATLALAPAPFPLLALSPPTFFSLKRPSMAMNIVRSLPENLRPFSSWYLQPPALFLLNEISAMAPRAISTHNWYKKTFGREYPVERKAIIPGIL